MNGYGARYQKFQTTQTQNLFDLTISGNTAGVGQLVSSGTLTLAGGNNITLSQAGNAITISGGAVFDGGVSSFANSAGTTGTVNNEIVFVGGNNITLSQSINAQSATITISGPNQSVQPAQTGISGIIGSDATYTSGTVEFTGSNMITVKSSAGQRIVIDATHPLQTGISGIAGSGASTATSGTVQFQNSNGITFGLNGNTITASHNGITSQSIQTQSTHVHIISGNTSGVTASMSTGTIALLGGNNITLSQNVNSVTVSALASSSLVGSGGVILSTAGSTISISGWVATLSGNTSGALALISSGTLTLDGGNNITLSQAGNAVTVSALASSSLVGSGGVILSTAGSTISISGWVATLSGNTSGALALISSGTLTLAGGNNITLSQAGNAVTISAFNQSVQTQSTHVHIISGNTSGTTASMSTGTLVLAGGNNITLSQNANSVTISQGGISRLSFWENFGGVQSGTQFYNMTGRSLSIQRVIIPAYMNVISPHILVSGNIIETGTFTASFALYTLNGISSASLASSGTVSNSLFNGIRYEAPSVTWNITPGEYLLGVLVSATATINAGSLYMSNELVNTVFLNSPTNIYKGIYTASTASLPASFQYSDINQSTRLAFKQPWVMLVGT